MSFSPDNTPENKGVASFAPGDLDRLLASPAFARSERLQRFLRLLVQRALDTPSDRRLKEVEIGALLYDRPPDYDPKLDSIVRVEATRLRKKLKDYYDTDGVSDPIRIVLPPGKYEVEFLPATPPPPPPPSTPPPPTRRPVVPWKLAFLGLALLLPIALFLGYGTGREQPPSILPLTTYPGSETSPAISPDGLAVAFCWDNGGTRPRTLHLQRIGDTAPRPLTRSTVDESDPAWSPDGSLIAFLRNGPNSTLELRTVTTRDSSERLLATLAASPTTPGLSWSPDGLSLATADGPDLVLISAQTGEKRPHFTSGMPGRRLSPAFSPDGRSLAYIKMTDIAVGDVFLAPLPSGSERQLTHDRAVLRGLTWLPDSSALIVSSQRTPGRSSLWRVPLDAAEPHRLTDSTAEAIQPSMARKQTRLVFSRRVDDINIWRAPAAGGDPTPLILSSALDSSPAFSPDATRIAFRSNRSGSSEIWVAAADGTNARRLTNTNGKLTGSPQWSPDGQWIAFDSRVSGNAEIYLVSPSGGDPRRLTSAPSNQYVPTWSRDSSTLYFTSDRSGAPALYRRKITAVTDEFVRPNAIRAHESADGRYLYYAHPGPPDGIYRAPLGGGVEEPVVPTLRAPFWGSWTLSRSALFYIAFVNQPQGETAYLHSYDLDTRQPRRLQRVLNPVGFDSAMDASPDAQWILYSQLDRYGSDLFIADNLR